MNQFAVIVELDLKTLLALQPGEVFYAMCTHPFMNPIEVSFRLLGPPECTGTRCFVPLEVDGNRFVVPFEVHRQETLCWRELAPETVLAPRARAA